ncbi:MAG: hypothetical protein Q7V62_02075, partial [Actinomycetota bacterium]|nr:hypothetical protein [Actinomycetota bacterium]
MLGVKLLSVAPGAGAVIAMTGFVASIVIVRAGDAALWLPAASVALTVIVWARSFSAELGVKVQAPPALAT